jgi:hypothetical protein
MTHYRLNAEQAPEDAALEAASAPIATAPAALVDERVVALKWQLPEEAQVALDEAEGLKAVDGAADYEYAVDVARRLQVAVKAAEGYYKPLKQFFDRLKRRVLDAEFADLDRLERECKRVTRLAADWHAAEVERERAAKEAQDRADRAKAEAERQAVVERLKRAAEQVPDDAVKAAIQTEAKQLADGPIATPKSTFQSSIPAAKGFTPSRVTYSARCDDLMALARAVVEGKVPLDAIEPNQARLNRAAVDSKEALAWPGVTVLKSGAPVVRS